MKIAFILKHFFYYSSHLIEELARHNDLYLFLDADSTEVFQTKKISERKKEITGLFPPHVQTFFFRSRFRVLELFAFLRLALCLRRLRPDVVHVHRSFVRINFYYWAIKRFFCPSAIFVLTVHDVTFHPGEASAYRRLANLSHRLVYDAADRIILHGHILKEELLKTYPHLRSKVYVLPHGELDIFKRWVNGEKTGCLDPKEKVVLCFGRMTPYKDLDTLIRAGRILSERITPCRIVIAGRGPMMAEKKALIERDSRFLCLDDYLPNDMVAYLFSRADVVVLPYIEASQSGVAALAYAFRKPVVATRIGALSEMVIHGKTGLLVSPGDPDEMAGALALLLEDSGLHQRMTGHIRKWVAETLSWERIAAQTMELYGQ